ncbi:MAG: hypothetical protein ACXWAT_02410 [Methylobacter sp.]
MQVKSVCSIWMRVAFPICPMCSGRGLLKANLTLLASGPHRRVNVIGALDWATGQVWHHLHEQTVNRAAVIDLIDGIARREQRMPLNTGRAG